MMTEGESSPFLSHPLLKQSGTYSLSTSNLSFPHLASFGFAEVVASGNCNNARWPIVQACCSRTGRVSVSVAVCLQATVLATSCMPAR